MPVDRTQQGRTFVQGIMDKLPDHLRGDFETFLESADSASFLSEVGGGVLRQNDYSSNLDKLRTDKAALEKWHGDLTTYARGLQERQPAGDPDPDPAKPAPTAGLTSEDVKRVSQETITAELARREGYYASFMGDIANVSAQHMKLFGEVLDSKAVLAHPDIAQLGVEGAYKAVHAAKFTELATKTAADDRAKLRAEVLAEVQTELASRAPGGVLPYAVGIDDSPLATLGQDGKQYTPEAAAALYMQMVAGTPS